MVTWPWTNFLPKFIDSVLVFSHTGILLHCGGVQIPKPKPSTRDWKPNRIEPTLKNPNWPSPSSHSYQHSCTNLHVGLFCVTDCVTKIAFWNTRIPSLCIKFPEFSRINKFPDISMSSRVVSTLFYHLLVTMWFYLHPTVWHWTAFYVLMCH